jgi:hypothetical protein
MNRHVFVGASIILAALALAAAGILSPTGRADTRDLGETSAAHAVDEPTPGNAAMRAYVNPETGELEVGVAPVAELALDPDTQNALRRDSEGLVEVRHPDGSVSIHLQGRFQSVSVARINDDGTVVVCTDDAEGVSRALQGNATSSATPEVE